MEQKSKHKNGNRPNPLSFIIFGILSILVFGVTYWQYRASEIDNMVTLPTQTPTPVDTAEISVTPVCFFNWAYNDAPEADITAIRQALDISGYTDAILNVSAYGEDEICQAGDEVVSSRFLLMDITVNITFTVSDTQLTNPTELGETIRSIVNTLSTLTDLSRLGYIEIEFLTPTDRRFWRLYYQNIIAALDENIKDDALYQLGIKPN